MKLSTDRILTTHVGSLPRPKAVADLLVRKDQGQPYDHAELDRGVRQAVADIVARQVATGIDVVSDGETSKISYSTYVTDRLTGFSNEGSTETARPHLDLAPFPEFVRKMGLLTGPRPFKRVSCVGPVKLRDRSALENDLAPSLSPTQWRRAAAGIGGLARRDPGVKRPIVDAQSHRPRLLRALQHPLRR